jgi:hypothetical protein
MLVQNLTKEIPVTLQEDHMLRVPKKKDWRTPETKWEELVNRTVKMA